MLKIIVFWTVMQMISVPCQYSGSFTDQYGVYHQSYTVPAVACSEMRETNMSKEFNSRKEAESFIEEAKKANSFLVKLSNFEIVESTE